MEANHAQARARRLSEAVGRIREQAQNRRVARQDEARLTHQGTDSEQSGGARGRGAAQLPASSRELLAE